MLVASGNLCIKDTAGKTLADQASAICLTLGAIHIAQQHDRHTLLEDQLVRRQTRRIEGVQIIPLEHPQLANVTISLYLMIIRAQCNKLLLWARKLRPYKGIQLIRLLIPAGKNGALRQQVLSDHCAPPKVLSTKPCRFLLSLGKHNCEDNLTHS